MGLNPNVRSPFVGSVAWYTVAEAVNVSPYNVAAALSQSALSCISARPGTSLHCPPEVRPTMIWSIGCPAQWLWLAQQNAPERVVGSPIP